MKKLMAFALTLVFVFGLVGCSQQKQLTLDKVVELSAKGEELTWSDFEQYKSVETGFGLYILVYDIDDIFQLLIGGSGNMEEPPIYIRLELKANKEDYIEVRTDDVKGFIEANEK